MSSSEPPAAAAGPVTPTPAPVQEGTVAAPGRSALVRTLLSVSLRQAGIGIVLVLVVAYFSVSTQYFATQTNVLNMLVQLSVITVLAVGMTFVILVGGIDLSVGSVLALGTVVGAKIMTASSLSTSQAILLGALACVGVGALCGLLNGFVSARWAVPSFIVTLGMLNIARGASAIVSNNSTINGLPQSFIDFGDNIFFGWIPMLFLFAITTVGLAWFVLRYTIFGRLIFAVGTNEEAVRLSGHNTRLIKVCAFVICGSLAGLAALVFLLRLNVGSPVAGVGYELTAIAAVILGGTSLFGGKGSVIGTFIGACILQVLDTGLQLNGVADNVRPIVTGIVIVVAVVVDTYRERLLTSLRSSTK